jgi:hypothetical protein
MTETWLSQPTPAGSQRAQCDPSGVAVVGFGLPGVSLRSTPG